MKIVIISMCTPRTNTKNNGSKILGIIIHLYLILGLNLSKSSAIISAVEIVSDVEVFGKTTLDRPQTLV